MSDEGVLSSATIEREKLALERYKAILDFWKFVLGSVFVALAIALIPPLFQLATSKLEFVKAEADRQQKQQQFHDGYIKEFMASAINQDIEWRIRFAEYFSNLSTEPYRKDWLTYLSDLRSSRDAIRKQIDDMEAQWRALAAKKDRDETELARLDLHLAWAYNEVGYVARNRSAVVNPRAVTETSSVNIPPWLATMREITGTQWSPSDGPPPATILEWIRFVSTKYPDTADYLSHFTDKYFAWEGMALAYSMSKAGIKPIFGATDTTRFLWTRAWLAFGTEVDTPQPGDVLVLDFGGSGLHAALFESLTDDGNYVARGGDQAHEVKVSTYLKRSVLAIRRPPT